MITTLLRGMNRVVPGHLEDSDCQSLKPGSQILSETPTSALRRYHLHSLHGDHSASSQPWAGPSG